jgi:hypothetical protein
MHHAIRACLAVLALAMAPMSLTRSAEPPQDPVEAVWRAQRLTFQYRSEGTMYACDILENKIRKILTQLGARDQVVVRRVSCRDFAGAAQLEVLMESPVIATAENIRAITQYDSEDELIARINGVHLPTAEELQRFPAVWERISMQRARKVHLVTGDCALVQQLRRQILPKMSVHIVKDIERVDCTQATPRLTVVALVATL